MPASVYARDPASARFLAGGLPELLSLLGSPLPLLPPLERSDGRDVFYVRFHPQLETLLQRFLLGLLAQVGLPEVPGLTPRADVRAREQAEYEAAFARALRSIRSTDRRLGLENLFWLAHSREVSGLLRKLETRAPGALKLRHSLSPLLSSFYRRLEQSVRKELDRDPGQPAAFLIGGRQNPSLIDAVIEDGFAFTEGAIDELDVPQFVTASRRHRLSGDVFSEIQGMLVREAERRLKEGERGLLARVARHLPGLPREQQQTRGGLVKIALNEHVMTYLLGDVWSLGSKLLSSERLKVETSRRPPSEVVDAFLDCVACLKRFEIVSHLRDHVVLALEQHIEDKARRGLRLYDFGEGAQVLNNAVNATVLFLDLRGFTKTSEGQISERDLTRELYTVFDAFVPHVRRFGGTVDKFLGDGMMVTYGTEYGDPLGPLNAVRTAILCQESLHRLREEGKTYFKMGVSIHYGRVYLARFIADEESVQSTVIGRNVNLAGRLSSAAKKPMDEDETSDYGPPPPTRALGLHVTVDGNGTLFNEGIAISRATFVQLESQARFEGSDEGDARRIEYFDDTIGRRILIRYAGDAKFKGVRASFPVFEVDYQG